MNEELQTPENGTEITEQVTPQANQETETPQTPPVEAPNQEEAGEQPSPEPQQPDYKNKFVESQRESILLHERNKQKEARIAQLTNKDTPQDDEMRSIYSNWDELDEGSKAYYRNQRAMEKRVAYSEQVALSLAEKLEFEDKLEDFLETPPDEFKSIKGKESEFKRFAKKRDNIGLPLTTLAKAFLFDIQDDIPQPHTPTLTPGLERGTGGPKTPPKPKKMSLEDASTLRKTNYEEYRRKVLAGEIEEDI
jgi:hypothetical protein